MFKNHKKTILSVIMAALISCSALTAFADETDSAEDNYSDNISSASAIASENTEPVSEGSKISSSDIASELEQDVSTFVSEIIDNASHVSKSNTDMDKDSASTSITDTDTVTSKPIPDYYGDDKYDTNGNLSLVREQKIIYDSAEMQFIAVTTKDGHIFYILIDYTAIEAAEDGEDGADARETVYFLNKVDDYDLFTLLYNDSDSDIGMRDYFAGMDNTFDTDTTSESDIDTDKENEKKSSSSSVGFYIVLAVAIAIFAAIYYFLKIRPKKKATIDDDDFDFDYEDEEEISDDAEIDDGSEKEDTKPEE